MKIIIHRFSGRPDPVFFEAKNTGEEEKTIGVLEEIIKKAQPIKTDRQTPLYFHQLQNILGYRGVEVVLCSHGSIKSVLVKNFNILVTYNNNRKKHYIATDFPPDFVEDYIHILGREEYIIESFILRNQDFNHKLFPIEEEGEVIFAEGKNYTQ